MQSIIQSLGTARTIVLAGLFLVALLAAQIHWVLLHRATRSRLPATGWNRPFRWGFGLWHVGMLRRDWLPEDGQHFHTWIVRSWLIGVLAMVACFGLLVRWII
jgi:hypothetical protein